MEAVRNKLSKAYKELDGIFSDKEAWFLFRVAAFAETIGWTLLVVGIVFTHYKWPQHETVLALSGSIHGIFYIFYIFIVIFGHRSMNWGVWRFIIAGVVSTFPFGALIFEMVVSRQRKYASLVRD